MHDVFVCLDQWDGMLQVLLESMHRHLSPCFMTGRRFNGVPPCEWTGYWEETNQRAHLLMHQGLLQWIYEDCYIGTLVSIWEWYFQIPDVMKCHGESILDWLTLLSIFCTLNFNCILHQCLLAMLCQISLMFTWRNLPFRDQLVFFQSK